jgi:hypothetical protein
VSGTVGPFVVGARGGGLDVGPEDCRHDRDDREDGGEVEEDAHCGVLSVTGAADKGHDTCPHRECQGFPREIFPAPPNRPNDPRTPVRPHPPPEH